MKKTLAVLMLATMLFSVGCGNQAQDAAKDAQQKVEQKADEVKKDAEKKVDEAKDAANQAADDAAKKVDEAKDAANQAADDAAKKVEETKEASIQATEDALKKADEMKADIAEKAEEVVGAANERVIALGGLMPGVSVDEVKSMFGEPTSTEGDTMIFADGLKVVLDGAQNVKAVSTTIETFDTPEGVAVGASEYSLNDYCGPADAIRQITNGAEYEYNAGDKKSVVVYKAQNGVITEIICSLK